MSSVTFRVGGTPRPQGSKRHVGGGRLVESSKGLKSWRPAVTVAATVAMGGRAPFEGPVQCDVTFWMPAPKRLTRRFPTVRPDIDKLERAIYDAMSGVVYVDDSQIIRHVVRKLYGSPGCQVTVEQIGASDGEEEGVA